MSQGEEIHSDVLIAGAGHAGGATARALRDLGFGGSILLVGAEPHLPHERPPLSKEMLSVPGFDLPLMGDHVFWDELAIGLRLGATVVAIGRAGKMAILSDGKRVHWGKLVLATGARPRRLPGIDHAARHVVRSLDDALELRARLHGRAQIVVIGAGPIGLEVAASIRPLVRSVTVVEAANRIMSRNVPADFAERIERIHADNGVTILTGQAVAWLADKGERLAVGLKGGRVLDADIVVEGIGVAPDVVLALSCGLACGDGIAVDAGYVTADPDVLAVGDAACPPRGRQESWAHAESSARAAARSILGLSVEAPPVPWFWSDQFGHRLQIAGDARNVDDARATGGATLYLRGGLVVAAAALDAPRDFSAARRLIGKPLPDQPSNQRPPSASVTARQAS